MEKVLFPQLAPEARLEALKQTAVGTERMKFTRVLSEAEIASESQNLAKLVQDLFATENEKSEVMKEYNEQIKSLKNKVEASGETLSKGEKDVDEKVFKYINYESKEVGFYDAQGNLIKVRPAQPEEQTPDMYGAGDVKQLENKEPEDDGIEDVDYEEVEE